MKAKIAKNNYSIKRIKTAATRFLKMVNEMEMRGEIVVSLDPESRFRSEIFKILNSHEKAMKKRADDIDSLIRILERYKNFGSD